MIRWPGLPTFSTSMSGVSLVRPGSGKELEISFDKSKQSQIKDIVFSWIGENVLQPFRQNALPEN